MPRILKQKNSSMRLIAKRHSAGFSLIEMIVVTAIIVILTTIILANYRENQNRSAVRNTAQKLYADIRRAQNMAISGEMKGGETPRGYGVYIKDNKTYEIFYNITGNEKGYSGSSQNIIGGQIKLPAEVEFDASSVNGDVFFVPPDPTTWVNNQNDCPPNGSACGTNPANFILKVFGGSFSKTVKVFENGKISVE